MMTMCSNTDEGAGYKIQRRVGLGRFANCRGIRVLPTRVIAQRRFNQLVRELENRPLSPSSRTVEYRLVAMVPQEIDRYTVTPRPPV